MKDASLITISTIKRTRTISLGPHVRIALGILILIMIVTTAIGVYIIYEFNIAINELTERKKQLDSQIVTLQSEMRDMQNEINTQRYIFEKLNELESLTEVPFFDSVQEQNNKPKSDYSLQENKGEVEQRIDKIKLSLIEKNWLLRIIPNGRPLAHSTRITSSYGRRFHPVTGKTQFHYGIDLAAKKDENVLATADGVIEFAGENRGGFGRMVVISHNYGFKTTYAHLNSHLVKKGAFVRRGEIIGKAGDTGITTGVHLHYEVQYLSKRINPYPFMQWNTENYNALFAKEVPIAWQKLIKLARLQIQNQ